MEVKEILLFPTPKISQEMPWLGKNFNLIFEVKMREFFHENFPERVVILLNCPKGR